MNTKFDGKCRRFHQAKESLNASPKNKKKNKRKNNSNNLLIHSAGSQLSHPPYYGNQSQNNYHSDRRRDYQQSNTRRYEPKRRGRGRGRGRVQRVYDSAQNKNVQIPLNNQEQYKREYNVKINPYSMQQHVQSNHQQPHSQYNDDYSSSHRSISNVPSLSPMHHRQQTRDNEHKYNIGDIVWFNGCQCKVVSIDGSLDHSDEWLYVVRRLDNGFYEYTKGKYLSSTPPPPSPHYKEDDNTFYGPQRDQRKNSSMPNHRTDDHQSLGISLDSLFF